MGTMYEHDFIENPALRGRENVYVTLSVNLPAVIESWRQSLYAFEWLDEEGKIKPADSLPETEKLKRADVESQIKNEQPLEQPVLGIGLMDNIEIGAGKAVLLTLAAAGIKTIPVHIPKNHRDDFLPFLA